jgi:Zn-dependent M28 family amino/carboxypeptidase
MLFATKTISMLLLPTSRSKRIIIALIMFLAALAGVVLLTGCPQNNETPKETTKETVAVAPATIDSATLIRHLIFLTSPVTEGREAGTPGNKLAQDYIVRQFDSLQVQKKGDSFLQAFPLKKDSAVSGHNIAGVVTGTKYPDTYIAITAHYDHLGARNGKIYYGADDNASGTACLLAMIQYFKQHPPQHSLLFVSFDAEEKGLLGSRYFADHSPVPLTSIIMNLNMDMISRNDSNEIFASGIFHYPFMKKIVDSAQQLSTVKIRFGHDDRSKGTQQDWTNQSDHYAFHLKKIPFLYFGVEDHPDYHQPSDTFDKINKQFYYNVSKMITETVKLLDRQEKLN